MEFLIAHWDEILLAITSIVTAASIIVKLTPTPKDDSVLEKVTAVLKFLAINKAK